MELKFNDRFLSMKLKLKFIVCVCFFMSIHLVYSQDMQPTSDVKDAKLQLIKQGKQLIIDAYIPRGITEFEL